MSRRQKVAGMPPDTLRDRERSQSSPDFEDSPTGPTLPAEVIDIIVDELIFETDHNTSRDILLSVSLASRRLCIRAYEHIFSKLHLKLVRIPGEVPHDSDTEGAHATLERLHNTLIQGLRFPDFAMVYHLQSVWITLKVTRREDIPLLDCFPMLSQVMQAIHGSTHGITRFIFEVNTEVYSGSFAMIPPVFLSERFNPKFSKAFRDLCHSTQLKTLDLRHIGLFSTTLRFTKIENIHLQEVTLEDDPKDPLGHHADAENGFIVQPTSMRLISIHRRQKLPYSYITSEGKLKVTDPVDYFLPSYHSNTSLAHPVVFRCLTSLTLLDRDRDCIQLHLILNLRSLKVIQKLTYHSAVDFGGSNLHSFFKSKSGVVRNLGSTRSLTVQTDIRSSNMFLSDKGRNQTRRRPSSSHFKPTRECWRDVDLHLTSAGIKLENINFKFKFILEPQEKLPVGHEEPSFVAENRDLIAAYFPRLSALRKFSMDVLVERQKPFMTTSGVEFNGSGAELW